MVLFMIAVGVGVTIGILSNHLYSKLSDKLIYGLGIFGAAMLIIHLLMLVLPLDAVDFEGYRAFQLTTVRVAAAFGISVLLNWKGPRKISVLLSR